MKTKKHLITGALFVAFIIVLIGFLGLADLIQWLVDFPENFTYWTFNNRILLMFAGTSALILAIYLNSKENFVQKKVMFLFTGLYLVLFMSSFVAPSYLMFRSQHLNAEFNKINELQDEYLQGEDEVIVLTINGDARAYPNKWIVQPHIAGDNIGGEEIVMTYCGLSHLAQAYQSNVNGDSLELKVMSQLKNNLVMFDNISKEPIAQVYGTMINSSTKLNSVPSTVMPYSSFKQLYPQGLVFNYYNSNIFDKLVYGMLEKTIYSQGGQYDKSTKELSFPSIKHIDERLHAKEQIYGVEINGESVAYTKEFLIRKGGTITEIVGKKTITVKYFDEFDFVNIYEGNVPEVDEKGFINKIQCKALPHYNRMLWKVWANFFKNTDVRI